VRENRTFSDANVYLYTRPLESAPKSDGKIKIFTHWGVVIEYIKDVRDNEWWIYEAVERKGKLRARMRTFIKTNDSELKLKKKNFKVSRELIEDFCNDKNDENAEYNFMHSNCQEFVIDLLVTISLPKEFSFQQLVKNALVSSSQSCKSIISTVIKNYVLKPFMKTAAAKLVMSKTLTDAGVGIGETVAKQIANELAENVSYQLLKGGFTWWQLFQIPAELLSRILGYHFFEKLVGYNHDQSSALSYGVSKLTSLGTAMAIGAVAGPIGVAGGALFWFIGEIITCLIRAVSYFTYQMQFAIYAKCTKELKENFLKATFGKEFGN